MEINFIPIQFYSSIYWAVVAASACAAILQYSNVQPDYQQGTDGYRNRQLAIFVIVYIGFRPLHSAFVDMGSYARALTSLQNGGGAVFTKDPGFSIFIFACSKVTNQQFFFLLCAVLYVAPVFLACKRWSSSNCLFLFVAFIGSFAFWAYGVNGVRNGIATSLLVFAFSCRSMLPRLIFSILAVSFHKSVMIPAVGFYLASTRIDIKWFFGAWALSIPLSLIFGSFWESLFSGLGFVDERVTMYIATSFDGKTFTDTGFRFDFLLYSASGVAAGFFYVYQMCFTDLVYKKILGAYLFSNAVWVLIIRADFSNRFVYLSWFIMAFVVFYPLVTAKLFRNNEFTGGIILGLYCLFSIYMGVFKN